MSVDYIHGTECFVIAVKGVFLDGWRGWLAEIRQIRVKVHYIFNLNASTSVLDCIIFDIFALLRFIMERHVEMVDNYFKHRTTQGNGVVKDYFEVTDNVFPFSSAATTISISPTIHMYGPANSAYED